MGLLEIVSIVLGTIASVVGIVSGGTKLITSRKKRAQKPQLSDLAKNDPLIIPGGLHGRMNMDSLTPIESLYILFLIDQFPNGIWGASLESNVVYYGDCERDPGSISISVLGSIAISHYTGSRTAGPILGFRKYLLPDRQSKRGAFGMLETTGTKLYPITRIAEHTRHTAAALYYFLFFDGLDHRAAEKALSFLLLPKVRTSKGRWVDDVGPEQPPEENTDPITVAFVIRALEEARTQLLKRTDTKSEGDLLASIESAIKTGLEYIFSTKLRTENGCWLYRYSSQEDRKKKLRNAYQYTTDVLASTHESCLRLQWNLDEYRKITEYLLDRAEQYEGLPQSEYAHLPDLDATAGLLYVSSRFPELADKHQKLMGRLESLCLRPEIVEPSSANGWSKVLLLTGRMKVPWSPLTPERAATLGELARAIERSPAERPANFPVSQEYIQCLLDRKKQDLPT